MTESLPNVFWVDNSKRSNPPPGSSVTVEVGFFRYGTKPIKVKEFMNTFDAALEFAEKTVRPQYQQN